MMLPRLTSFMVLVTVLYVLSLQTSIVGATARGRYRRAKNLNGRCQRSDAYNCDCEKVPRRDFKDIEELFGEEKLDCSPICDDDEFTPSLCTPQCEDVICVTALEPNKHICGVLTNRTMMMSLRAMDCLYNESMMMNECVRDDNLLTVDNQTLAAVLQGYCVPGCGVDESNLKCHYTPRYWGDPYIIEPPLEPPEEPPIEEPSEISPEEMPEEPPIEEPSEISPEEMPEEPPEYEFDVPDIEPTEPPEEDIEEPIVPASEPELEYDMEFEYPAEPPVEDVYLNVSVGRRSAATLDNRLRVGPWSECLSQCNRNYPRTKRRSVTCHNAFGTVLPASDCNHVFQPRVVEECPIMGCDGSYYYALGDWSKCSQSCSEYIAKTGKMTIGEKSRNFTCFDSSYQPVDNAACEDLVRTDKVELSAACGSRPCRPVRYSLGSWKDCSCQTRRRARDVRCIDMEGVPVDADMCDALDIPKPRSIEYCNC